MGVSDDVIKRLGMLSADRSGFETQWDQVDAVAATQTNSNTGFNRSSVGNPLPQVPHAAIRSKKLYDSTGVNAVDRLSSGIEALVIPQSEYWHGLKPSGLQRTKLQEHEKRWFEDQRNLLFETRYDADSGWTNASQSAIRSCVSHGNGFIWTEEGFDQRALIEYRFMPLRESYIATDHRGIVIEYYRNYHLTAQQAVIKFGEDRVPQNIRSAAATAERKDERFEFIHAITMRNGMNRRGEGIKSSKWESLHVEVETKTLVRDSGFYEFPVIDFRWLPDGGQVWGEGPVMKCLSDIQSLQVMAKNEMIAGQQSVQPPLLVANAGVINRPNSTPNAVNLGGLNAQGQEMIKPMFTGQRLDFHTMVLEAKRNQVKDSMYLNLFALLVQNPQMSATEAMIRANEKGELLGPAGARLQQSLSRMIEREMNMLIRRGLYSPKSVYRVPASLAGRHIVPEMTSKLDKLRRAKEGEGIMRVLEAVAPIAQADPTIVDEIDSSETIRQLRDIFGAPVGILRDPKQVAQMRAQRQQAAGMAQGAATAKDLATASKQGTDALAGMKAAGFL